MTARPAIRPLTLRQPVLGAIMAGHCTAIRRLARGVFGAVQPGDLLWIREPFRLAREWDRFSPTAAEMLGARCHFAANLPPPDAFLETDQPPGVETPLGAERMARTLLRVWHRHHCEVTSVSTERLKDITNAEIEAAGYLSRADFARDWNRGAQVNTGRAIGTALHWSANPAVAVMGLRYVAAPIPEIKVRPRARTTEAA